MAKFITNKEELFSEHIKKILPTIKQIDILVGFFYFSGFQRLYKDLKDKKVRILIGMDIEKDIKNYAKEVYHFKEEKLSKQEIRQRFFLQFKDLFNNTDLFDTKETREAIDIFISKIIDGTLEIRKTIDPNHSKMYLFHYVDEFTQEGEHPGVLITGSSNFTYSGLQGRYELNVRFDDKETFEKGLEIFEELWDEAVSITEGGEDDELVKLLTQETWLKLWQPYALYIRLLYEYFEIFIPHIKTPSYLTGGKFFDLKYQVDALKMALKIIQQYGGVIIADVVGLGKSILGASIIANLGHPAIIISPPHLMSQWKEYGEIFKLNFRVFSSGKLQEAKDFVEKYSHYEIILVDEAHRFRNDDTISYGLLHQITQGKKVILLTATPFNNEPKDIFNLIKLFQIPKKSTLGGGNLQIKFNKLQQEYIELRRQIKNRDIQQDLKKLSEKIKNLIGPVMIRRSRIDLMKIKFYKDDLEKQKIDFAEVETPKTIEFDLGNLEDKYIFTIQVLLGGKIKGKKLKYSRYSPLIYLKNWQKYEKLFDKYFGYSWGLIEGRQRNMHLFITRQIVGRFESSLKSFKHTLGKIIDSYEKYLKWIKQFNAIPIIRSGIMPDIDEIDFSQFDIEEIKGEKEKVRYILGEKYDGFLVDIKDLKEDFLNDLKNDYKILTELWDIWKDIEEDPKLDSLIKTLKDKLKENPDRKIVIFSQYADTVNYLYSQLSDKFRVLSVTGSNKTEKIKKKIQKNFDASLKCQEQEDNYNILIATDSISEGYNLHRAGIVINYDIPYNPTIIIQRVGRINRIGKKIFDKIYIYNYFPSFKGERIVRHKQIAKLKLDMIGLILGIDTKILDETDPLGSFYQNQLNQYEAFENEESWDTPYLNEYLEIKKKKPELLEKIKQMPKRVRVRREVKIKDNLKLLVLFKKGTQFMFYAVDNNFDTVKLDLQIGFEIFKAKPNEQGLEISKDFYKFYNKLKESLKNQSIEISKISTQTKKSILSVEKFKKLFGDEYSRLLLKVIKDLGALPQIYMKILRDLEGKTLQEVKKDIQEFKKQVSIDYLQRLLQEAKKFDLQQLDLIMIEEFEK